MYLRTTSRRRKDGYRVEYYAIAHNVWDPERQRSETRVLLNLGRADQVERASLARLCDSTVLSQTCSPAGLRSVPESPRARGGQTRPSTDAQRGSARATAHRC